MLHKGHSFFHVWRLTRPDYYLAKRNLLGVLTGTALAVVTGAMLVVKNSSTFFLLLLPVCARNVLYFIILSEISGLWMTH